MRLLEGDSARSPSYVLTRWLFLRLLGFIYFFAFASLAVQIMGLIGSHGILPVDAFLHSLQNVYGSRAQQLAPTLFWLNDSDSFLVLVSAGGALLSALVVLDVAPGPVLAVLWVAYLSLFVAGQDFMAFQWDILLLETGFLAIFLAPWRILPGYSRQTEPARIVVWLYRWLLFRLVFGSGVSKLMSGDPTWQGLAAMTYHYETQPLPSPLAWYAYHLPFWFHQLETALTLIVEVIVPLLIFAPRRVRFVAAWLMIVLQALIIATGNYTFFNLLTIALCVLLFDDAYVRRFFPPDIAQKMADAAQRAKQASTRIVPVLRQLPAVAVAVVIVTLSLPWANQEFNLHLTLPRAALDLGDTLAPYYIVNSYGLFASMTTSRDEIIIEGSNDGQTWLPYEFKDKPGDVMRSPRWVVPYQPRLDWQMWFAALGYSGQWFDNLMHRLLESSPDVLALLGKNPFPDAPPHYVRAMIYDYHFTDPETHAATGAWWQRGAPRWFYSAISLDGK